MSVWSSNSLKRFLLITLPYMNDILICTQRTTKLFIPIMKSFVDLNVLIQNETIQWFMARTHGAVVQGIVIVGHSPYFYYELFATA